MPADLASASPDRTIRIGGWLLVLGMLLTLVAMTPIISNHPLSPIWWLLSWGTTTAGLVTILLGVRGAAKRRSRAMANRRGGSQ